jgi:DNA-binding MarR family transcriptional regulator
MPGYILDVVQIHARAMNLVRRALGGERLTPVQATLVAAIGDERLPTGMLMELGYFQGSQPRYNISILEEAGYVKRTRAAGDKRMVIVSLTPKGLDLCIRLRRALTIKEAEAT